MTSSKTKILACLCAAAALCLAGTAQAGQFELHFIGAEVSGDVFITTTGSNLTAATGWLADADVGAGQFTVTGLSSYAGADNAFNAAAPYITLGGLSFATTGGGDYNLAFLNGYAGLSGYGLLSSTLDPQGAGSAFPIASVDLTVTAVPEPGNLALMLAGVLGLVGVTRRRAVR